MTTINESWMRWLVAAAIAASGFAMGVLIMPSPARHAAPIHQELLTAEECR